MFCYCSEAIRTMDAVNELDDTDSRDRGLLIAGRIDDALEKA